MACSRTPCRGPSSLVISIEQRYWRRSVRMMNDYLANTLSLARREPQLTAAGIIAVVGALTIGGFYFFQYVLHLSLIHISEPTRLGMISYAVFCLKKKKT